jgi:hypothetical protein
MFSLSIVSCWYVLGMWGYGLDWAGLGYRQVAGTCECGNETSGNFLTSCKPVSFSRRTLMDGVSE